jgi:hypothetical protein
VQRVLSSKAEHEDEEKLQCKKKIHMFLIIKGCRVLTIIDSGSCSNLVSRDLVKKLGLATHSLPHPYHLEWLNNSGKAKVTKSACICNTLIFKLGTQINFARFLLGSIRFLFHYFDFRVFTMN